MLYALSLAGDGDQVDAIAFVEERGDLLRPLAKGPPDPAGSRAARSEMAAALCSGTGDDPARAARATRPIDDPTLFGQVSAWLRR